LHLTYFKIWWRHWYPSMWLFISLMCSPSSWATEDVLSYTISFLIFFFISPVQEILPLTNFVFKLSRPLVGKRNINFRQLVPSPLISTFLASSTRSQRNPDKEKLWVPCHLLSKSFPKIPSNIFFLDINLLRASFS
jgi:hypothetical protein